jgi:hypothetical protein
MSRRRAGQPAIDLIEEAVALLRRAPAAVHLAYYLGAIPFWLGALYFLADMSRNAYAAAHVADWSLGLALLYLWKKSWQTVSAAQLRAVVTGRPDAAWTLRRVARMVAVQTALQPWSFAAKIIAAHLVVPFVWVSAFFQNVTVLGDGTEPASPLFSRAARQARLWTFQAHGVSSTLYVFTFFVWLNVCLALAAGPLLLKTLFGFETAVSRSYGAFFNTTFLAVSVALTSLAVDPLRKAVFVLRCFRGQAIESGADLVADLAHLRARPAMLAALILLSATPAYPSNQPRATSQKEPAAELSQRIHEVLERREYAWRAPRESQPASGRKGWLQGWLESAGRTLGDVFDHAVKLGVRFRRWLQSFFKSPSVPGSSSPVDWIGLSKAVAVLLAAVLAAWLGWLIVRAFLGRKKAAPAQALATPPPIDLTADQLVADQLPEDGWLALAREHAARGELALAQRAAWLAGLAHLGTRELIGIARHKSNRDYERELRRRARDRAGLLGAFDENLGAFERAWYGRHEVTPDGYRHFERNFDRIRQS